LTLRPCDHLPGQFGLGLETPVLRDASLGPAGRHAVCKPGFWNEQLAIQPEIDLRGRQREKDAYLTFIDLARAAVMLAPRTRTDRATLLIGAFVDDQGRFRAKLGTLEDIPLDRTNQLARRPRRITHEVVQILRVFTQLPAYLRHVPVMIEPQQPTQIARPIATGVAGLRAHIPTIAFPKLLQTFAKALHRSDGKAPAQRRLLDRVFIF